MTPVPDGTRFASGYGGVAGMQSIRLEMQLSVEFGANAATAHDADDQVA